MGDGRMPNQGKGPQRVIVICHGMAWPAAQNGVWKGLREDNSNWSRPKLQSRPAAEPKKQRCFLIKRLLTRAYLTRTLTFPIIPRFYLFETKLNLPPMFPFKLSPCFLHIVASKSMEAGQGNAVNMEVTVSLSNELSLYKPTTPQEVSC